MMAEKPGDESSEMSGLDESSSAAYVRRSWPGPRTVVVPRAEDAFGFTLRHLVVQPPERTSSVDTEELQGDDECIEDQALAGERSGSSGSGLPMETIFVKQVKQDSKAHSAGLRTGDRIVSINGENVAGKTYSQVIRLIHGSDSALTLMVIPQDEDVLQMAYKTSDDGAKEVSGRNPSVLSTCHVSLSPATHRRGQELCNRNSVMTSSQATAMEGRFLADEFRSASPSLHIRVRINPGASQNRHSGSVASNIMQPVTYNSRDVAAGDVWISGGSSFYPVTTTARKTRPEDYALSAQQLSVGRDEPLTASRQRPSPLNALSSELDNPSSSEHQRSSFTYNLTPLQPTDACPLRQSAAKLKSYHEITLSQSADCGHAQPAPHPLYAQPPVVLRASPQESSRLSSHFIHMAPPSGPPMHYDAGNPVAANSVPLPRSSASVVVARQQMFVTARPQSYESLFGHGRVDQTPPASCALTTAASRSSSELLDKSSLSSRQPAAAAASVLPRLSSAVDQPRPSLITERMRRFESGDNADGSRSSRVSKVRDEELSAIGGCPQFGYDSVAKRAAQFEDTRQSPGESPGKRNVVESLKVYRAPATVDQSKELWLSAPTSPSPIGSRQVPASVTIPLYFRADPSTNLSKSTTPAAFNHHGESVRSRSSVDASESGGGGLAVVVVSSSSSSDPGCVEKKTGIYSHEMQVTAKGSCRLSAGHQEKMGAVEKTADGSSAMTVESISQSTTLAMAATLGIKEQLFAGETFEPPSSPALINTLAKSGNSNIKKFVAFFTDKSPKMVDPDKKSSGEAMVTGGSIAIEGCLNCKAAVAEGKKASDRSWKPFWAVLRGHFLGLYKDRYSLTSGLSEEQSVCVKSSSVEVAVDYLKKRNVFQVTTASGSKFLFQAEDPELMSNWVKAIQANSEAKEIEPIASNMTLGQNLQRAVTVEKTSPQVAPKAKKQSSKVIPVSKSPASPLSKTRKTGYSVTDSVESPRVKEHKTWKGKMVKKFGRHRSGSGATVEMMSEDQEPTGTFGVPLDSCFPSLFNECIPLIVETCTRIVEERGIENQGIYRVPGNSCAVNTLRDELNKFPENIDAETEKWQDVNVVSSLLKLFFRKLPDSLITDELYEPVITAYRLQNPEKKMLKLKKLLHDLPEHNFETFRFLAQHLNRVASREEINKMDARNLAIVFGPTLVRPQDQSVVLMVKDMSDQCRVVETIIVNVDWFFSSWDEDVNVPLAEENEPISSINSELLAKAENLMNPTEMTRDLSAKDLVSSILHAANKKIRRKDRNKSAESIETEGESDVSYSDRNFDQEMEIQGMRELLESGNQLAFATTSSSAVISSSPSAPPAGSSSLVSTETAKTQQQTVAFKTSMERVVAKPNTAQARSASDVKRYPAYHFDPAAETESSKPKILRRYSEDAFGVTATTEHDEVTLRPFMRDGSLVEHAEQQLRRLHHDTRALYHKQELERMEREKRAVAKERVEREFSKTIQELELEDAEPKSPSALSSDVATSSSGDGSSVRSAMDRCKLAMYENRLRFFTDFGDRKAFSPVFRQGTAAAAQTSSSASVSPTPFTRRLSDQPIDSSLRREEDYLLVAPPTRAHSVSPSIIGREARYGFDAADRNSESSRYSREPSSSSAKRFDRSLAVVSENQSSSDLAASHSLAVSQPLVLPLPARNSSKGPSTSSVGSSLAVSFATDSSTTRSSMTSFSGDGSSDMSAKDSVFPEKTPSESEQTLLDVADISHRFRTSFISDDIDAEDDGRRDSSVFDAVKSQRNHNIRIDAAACTENKLEQPEQRAELSEKITAENHFFHAEIDVASTAQGNETSGEPSDFLSDEKASSSPPSKVGSNNADMTRSKEFRTSEGKVSELGLTGAGGSSHVTTVRETSELRDISGNKESELNAYQRDNCRVRGGTDSDIAAVLANVDSPTDAQQLRTGEDNDVKVQLNSGRDLAAESASDDVQHSLPSTSENGGLVQTGALNGLVRDKHHGDLLSNGNTNQTAALLSASERTTQSNDGRCEAAVVTDGMSGTTTLESTIQVFTPSSKSMEQSANAQKVGRPSDCEGLQLSSSVHGDTPTQQEVATQSSSAESRGAELCASSDRVTIKQSSSVEREDVAQSNVEHTTVVTHSADVERSALILPRPSALPSAFTRTFTRLDDSGASALKQRHSICSSSVRDYLQGMRKAFNSSDGKLRRSESRDLVKLHRTASLPLLPCP